jgi:hypothetical protein
MSNNEEDFETVLTKSMLPHKADWRESGDRVWVAFFKGNVRPRDYHVVAGLFSAHLLTLALAIDVSVRL